MVCLCCSKTRMTPPMESDRGTALQPQAMTHQEKQLRGSLEEEREAVLAFLYTVIDCVSPFATYSMFGDRRSS